MRTARGKIVYVIDNVSSGLKYYIQNSESNSMACGVKYIQSEEETRLLKSGIDNIEALSLKDGIKSFAI